MKKIIAKKENIKKLPKAPGVYQFVDNQGLVLYVGKAKNLNNRLKSYYAKQINRGAGILIMLKEAKYIKVIECESEIEAVVLEAELINKLQPKYNIRQKDDKSFSMIEITHDDFPKVIISRYKEYKSDKKSSDYFGPYPSRDALKRSLKYLRKIFPYMDCSKTKFNSYKKRNRPCLYGEINICNAPCVERIDKSRYRKNINHLKTFLRGGKKKVVKELEAEMKKLSRDQRYEEAAETKNKLESLHHIQDVAVGIKDGFLTRENIFFERIESYDISNIFGKYAVGGMSVFIGGEKSTSDYRKFKIKTVKATNDLEMLREVIVRRLKNDWPKPDLFLIDGGENQLQVANKALKENNIKIPVVSISKGAKRDKNQFHFSDSSTAKYIKSTPNVQRILIQARDEAHRYAISYYRKLHQKGLFD